MKVAVGADHAGFDAKERLKAALAARGATVIDVGTSSVESTDYPDYARAAAEKVACGEADRAVLVCGTGIGMAMTANKVRGVRAALCHDAATAEMGRRHNDANVLCMGARVVDAETMEGLLGIFLDTPFDGGRHARRVQKIEPPE